MQNLSEVVKIRAERDLADEEHPKLWKVHAIIIILIVIK